MLEHVARRASEFDLLHFHLDYHPFSIFSRKRTPFVTTLHGRLDLPELQPVFEAFPNAPLVSISNAQRLPLPNANWIGTVHYGLPSELLTPAPVAQTYLAFLGRISPEKGLDRAIDIAAKSGLPLKVAAKVDKNDTEYFRTVIRPLIERGGVEFIGEIGDGEKAQFLSGGACIAGSHRLAGTVWCCHDRSHGVRRSGSGVQRRLCTRNRRERPHRRHRRNRRGGDRGVTARYRARPQKNSLSASCSAFPPRAWRKTIFDLYRSLLNSDAILSRARYRDTRVSLAGQQKRRDLLETSRGLS